MRKAIIPIMAFLFPLVAFGQTQSSSTSLSIVEAVNTGSTHTWATVTNAVRSDDIRTSTGNLPSSGDKSTYIKMTDWGFTIPAGSAIDGIEVWIEKSTDNTSKTYDDHVYIVKAGIIGGTAFDDKRDVSAWAGAEAYFLHGSTSDLWGETWTVAEINASDFGVAFAAKRTGGGPQTVIPNVDHVRITISYTGPLPIKLISFTGEPLQGKVKLAWTTASELNNDFFTLERSLNGATFTEIAEIPGSGTTEQTKSYSEFDNSPITGTNYYRLKQTDFDGGFEYSKILAVKYTQPNTTCTIDVIPNPCPAVCNIMLDGCDEQDFVSIGLYDLLGNTIISNVPIKEGNGFFMDARNNIAPGTYIVMGATEQERVSKKIIIQ